MFSIFNIFSLYFQWNIQVWNNKKQLDIQGWSSENVLEILIYEISTYAVYGIWIIEDDEIT